MRKSDLINEISKINDILVCLKDGVSDDNILKNFNIKASRLRAIKNNSDLLISNLQRRIDNIDEIVGLYKNCMTLEEISELKGTSRQNISRIISLDEVDRCSGGVSKLKSERKEKLLSLVEDGKCLEDICDLLDVTEEVVRNYANELGIKIISKKKLKTNEIKNRIKELRKLGKTQLEISCELNLSQSYVSKILLTEYKRTFLTSDEYKKRDSEIYEKYLTGSNIKEIALCYGMKENNVRRVIYKMENKKKEKEEAEA